MSEFKFEKSQRVFLPAAVFGGHVQAVVTARESFVWREPEYRLQFLNPHEADSLGFLVVGHTMQAESQLDAAQPPEMMPTIDAAKLVQAERMAAMIEVRRELDPELDRLRATIARLERAAARKAKAKAKRNARKRR